MASQFALVYPAADKKSLATLIWADQMNTSLHLRGSLNRDASVAGTEDMVLLRLRYASVLTAVVQGVRDAAALRPLCVYGPETYPFPEGVRFGWFAADNINRFTTNQVRVEHLVWVHAAIFSVLAYVARETKPDQPIKPCAAVYVVRAAALAAVTRQLVDGWIEASQLPASVRPLVSRMACWADLLDAAMAAATLSSASCADDIMACMDKSEPIDARRRAAWRAMKVGWQDTFYMARQRCSAAVPGLCDALWCGYTACLIRCIQDGHIVLEDKAVDPAVLRQRATDWLRVHGLDDNTVVPAPGVSAASRVVPPYLREHVARPPAAPYEPFVPLAGPVARHTALADYRVSIGQPTQPS